MALQRMIWRRLRPQGLRQLPAQTASFHHGRVHTNQSISKQVVPGRATGLLGQLYSVQHPIAKDRLKFVGGLGQHVVRCLSTSASTAKAKDSSLNNSDDGKERGKQREELEYITSKAIERDIKAINQKLDLMRIKDIEEIKQKLVWMSLGINVVLGSFLGYIYNK